MHYYSGYKIIIIVINCPCQKDPFVYSNYEESDLIRYRIIYNVLWLLLWSIRVFTVVLTITIQAFYTDYNVLIQYAYYAL